MKTFLLNGTTLQITFELFFLILRTLSKRLEEENTVKYLKEQTL
jgi:hypothetical protein